MAVEMVVAEEEGEDWVVEVVVVVAELELT